MRHSLALLSLAIALTAIAPAASADTFVDRTPGLRAFAVPAGVNSLSVSVTGGAGGDFPSATPVRGGRGALVTGMVAVSPGEQLQLTVASNGTNGGAAIRGAAGSPDGGVGGWSAAGGGGATRIIDCQGVVCSVAVIAAGGGGAGATGTLNTPPSYPALPGGPGGDAGARGTDGTSDRVNGGGGGQPGTSSGVGAGGVGPQPGDPGNNSAGGAGGRQSDTYDFHQGGGGGGGGVFGGGGGGSGDVSNQFGFDPETTGGGGGGGGSSLPPPGGNVTAAMRGAAPEIVLTWVPPSGSNQGPGPGSAGAPAPGPGLASGGAVTAASVSGETLSPSAFVAAPSGPSALAARRRFGTRVGYTLNRSASVSFAVVAPQPGRIAKGGRCLKRTKAKPRARRCTRQVALPGSFTRAGVAGLNSFRFTGRIGGRKLKPGRYQLVASPNAGASSGLAARAYFQIVR